MRQPALESYKLEIGALHRRSVMANLDLLDLPYREYRGFAESIIIVKVYNERQSTALRAFRHEFRAWQERLQMIDDEYNRQELARKNRWRKLTFRKPLASLAATH